MAKTKFKFKIKELEIEFEGDQQDVPKVSQAMSNQLGGMLQTPRLMSNTSPAALHAQATAADVIEAKPTHLRKSKPKSSNNGSSKRRGRKKEPAVVWSHDADKWGNPREDWNPTKKAMWIMFVVEHEVSDVSTMTSSRIATTFNEHFKSFGQIQASNVSRDMKKVAKLSPPQVQSDTTQEGDCWFLLEAGKKAAQELVKEARGLS